MRYSEKSGFTLIELLVVLAVLAVVVGAVVVAIDPIGQINRAKDGQIKNDIGSISTALQSYYSFYGEYPAVLSDLVSSGDLIRIPTPPDSPPGPDYTSGYTTSTQGCDGGLRCWVMVWYALKAPQGNKILWCWVSTWGAAQSKSSVLQCR